MKDQHKTTIWLFFLRTCHGNLIRPNKSEEVWTAWIHFKSEFMLLLKSGFVSLSLFDSVFSLRSKLPAERTWRLNFSRDRRWINECGKDRKEGCKKISLKMWSQRLAQLRSGPSVREYQRGTLWSYWQKLKRLKKTVYPKSNIIANKHYSCFRNAHRLDCSQSLYM